MPGKMTKSILRPPFRPPRYRQPSAARVYLAGRSEKRKIFTSAPESSGESPCTAASHMPASVWPHGDVKFDRKESWVDSSFGVFGLSGHCPCDANAGGGRTRSGWWCDSGRRHRGHHWRGIRRRPRSGHRCDHRWCHRCRYRCRRRAAAGWLPLLPGCLLSTAARRSVARYFA